MDHSLPHIPFVLPSNAPAICGPHELSDRIHRLPNDHDGAQNASENLSLSTPETLHDTLGEAGLSHPRHNFVWNDPTPNRNRDLDIDAEFKKYFARMMECEAYTNYRRKQPKRSNMSLNPDKKGKGPWNDEREEAFIRGGINS